MTETQQRFLRAIAQRVPVEHVTEVHLFPPIRQGGVETGVAVIAEDPRRPAPESAPADSIESVAVVDEATVVAVIAAEATEQDAPETADAGEAAATLASDADEGDLQESPYAMDDDEGFDEDEDESDDDAADDDVGLDDEDEAEDDVLTGSAVASAARVASRFTIHTARYRLTLKGVDRGKWEVDVVAEADAPLDALDAVVRGVQRRAGEGAEPDRLSAEAFRDALEAPLATLER